MTALVSLSNRINPTASVHTGPVSPGLMGTPKRAMDILFALAALIFLAPLLAALAIMVKLSGPGPVLFRHRRCGAQGQHFTLLKFRTMHVDADTRLDDMLALDQDAHAAWHTYRKLRVDPRVTKLGHFLRRSSLDELPQLINVLRGDMSLVGPRPIVDEELARFGAAADLYNAARPGITGLWQTSGRNETDFPTRVALDSDYVTGWSFAGDVKILLRTIPVVLAAKGAY